VETHAGWNSAGSEPEFRFGAMGAATDTSWSLPQGSQWTKMETAISPNRRWSISEFASDSRWNYQHGARARPAGFQRVAAREEGELNQPVCGAVDSVAKGLSQTLTTRFVAVTPDGIITTSPPDLESWRVSNVCSRSGMAALRRRHN